MVYFCIECDDQEPWKSTADRTQQCPSCRKTTSVKAATRFSNLEMTVGDD